MLLNDPEWSKWSDREIARQCKVSQTFVSSKRKNLTDNVVSENEAKTRTYTTKHGTTATMQVGNIGKKDDLLTESASIPPIQGEESTSRLRSMLTASDGNGNGNGEMETDKTKPTIDPNDYAIAFMTNINHINPDLLKEARKRIDKRLAAIDKPST